MARDHARLIVAIQDDPDWCDLTSSEQSTYVALLTNRDLSYCGVCPLIPERFVGTAKDRTARTFARDLARLEVPRFVVVDRETAEILVRTYVRHDGILKQRNITKSMIAAKRKVRSGVIVAAIDDELVRLYRDDPEAKGWVGFEEYDPDGFTQVQARAKRKGSAKGYRKPSARASATPSPLSPLPNTQRSKPSSSSSLSNARAGDAT